jgi:predicted porin
LLLAALSCTTLAAAAQTMTIGGIADMYVGSAKGSTRVARLGDGGFAPSRLNFSGTEDLGGGSKAYFRLEMAIGMDEGVVNMGGGFGSQSFVGVSGRWGALELGRQLTPMFRNFLVTSPFIVNPNWSPAQMVPKTDGQGTAITALAPALRQSNVVQYHYGDQNSPGWRLDLQVGAGEGSTTAGRYGAVSVSHRGSNYFAHYTGQRQESGTAAARAYHVDMQVVGGVYSFGAFTVSGNYAVVSSDATGALKATTTLLGGTYTLGQNVFKIEGARRDVKSSARDADLLVVGYDYLLSKRTTLYARTLGLQNKNQAANTMALATVNANSGHDVKGYALGVRHNF